MVSRLCLPSEVLPELRCTFAERSIIPDLVVISTNQIPVDEQGEVAAVGLDFAPAWVIEILSPDQRSLRITRKILSCLKHGTQLGGLIDPGERVVLVYRPDQLPTEHEGEAVLPTLVDISLKLTADQLFSWLQVKARKGLYGCGFALQKPWQVPCQPHDLVKTDYISSSVPTLTLRSAHGSHLPLAQKDKGSRHR